jgi:hypothetical protein
MDSKLNVKSALNQIFNRASNDFNFKNISYLPQIILSVDMGMVFCGCLGYILLKVIGLVSNSICILTLLFYFT